MRKRIGEFLLERGVLTSVQVGQILKHSRETGLRFGDAGLDLGILTREKMLQVFGPSFAVDFFHLEPQYFPKITQDLLPASDIVRLGVLPLGFKTERRFFRTRKILNLGMLDPSRKEAAEEAMRLAAAKLGDKELQGYKVFLVLADQFIRVLSEVYGFSEAEYKGRDASQIDGTLSMFLEHGR